MKIVCAWCLLGLNQDLPECCFYLHMAMLLIHIRPKQSLSLFIACVTKNPLKKKHFEESLNILDWFGLHIQLCKDTASIIRVFLLDWIFYFLFYSHLAQTSALYHKCPLFSQSCLWQSHKTWQIWSLLMQQTLCIILHGCMNAQVLCTHDLKLILSLESYWACA